MSHRPREEWDRTLAPRTCRRCGGPMPIGELSIGEDVAGNPTLVLGYECRTDGCEEPRGVLITSMRDGGLHLKGRFDVVERIDPPTAEERAEYLRFDAEGRAAARRSGRRRSKRVHRARQRRVVGSAR